MNESNYHEWNTVLTPIQGSIKEGEKLKYEMTNQNKEKSIINIKVKKIVKHKELNQVGGMPGILTFNHKYFLEKEDEGTRLIQHEIDRGIGMLFWNSTWIEPAYQKRARTSKKRLERPFNI